MEHMNITHCLSPTHPVPTLHIESSSPPLSLSHTHIIIAIIIIDDVLALLNCTYGLCIQQLNSNDLNNRYCASKTEGERNADTPLS